MTSLSHDKISSGRTPGRSIADQGLLHLVGEGERLRAEGHHTGMVEGLTQALLFLYQNKLGAPPETLAQSLRATEDPTRLSALLPVFLSGDADTISRAVLL